METIKHNFSPVQRERMAQANAERESFIAEGRIVAQRVLAEARALIIAEQVVNRSDSQSDYHGHQRVALFVLAVSTHDRDDFREMRRAAARFLETQDLAVAGPEAEHREKYSQGGGYYLAGEGGQHATGFSVRKHHKYSDRSFYQDTTILESLGRYGFAPVRVPVAADPKPEPILAYSGIR